MSIINIIFASSSYNLISKIYNQSNHKDMALFIYCIPCINQFYHFQVRGKYRKPYPVAIITVEHRSKSSRKINFLASHSNTCSIYRTPVRSKHLAWYFSNVRLILNEPLIYTSVIHIFEFPAQ